MHNDAKRGAKPRWARGDSNPLAAGVGDLPHEVFPALALVDGVPLGASESADRSRATTVEPLSEPARLALADRAIAAKLKAYAAIFDSFAGLNGHRDRELLARRLRDVLDELTPTPTLRLVPTRETPAEEFELLREG